MKYRRADMLLPVASEAVLPAILFASGPSCGPLASLGLDRDVVKENIPADAIGDDAAELGGIEVGGAFGVPTVREPDRLAGSSRNRYLDSKDRTRARLLLRILHLLRILTATVRRFRAGDHVGAALYQVPERVTHRRSLSRHGGRRPAIHDFSAVNKEKSWMPTSVGMTDVAPSVRQSFGRLVLEDATDAPREQGFGVNYLELVDGPRKMDAVSCAVASCGAGARETSNALIMRVAASWNIPFAT